MVEALDHDDFLLRREADIMIQQGTVATDERMAAHRREHEAEAKALALAMDSTQKLYEAHTLSHDESHTAHIEKHGSEGLAVKTALDAVARERLIHAEAHERDHAGHLREHGLAGVAITKAEEATDKRFGAANGFRETFDVRIQAGATKEAVEGMRKEYDRRLAVLEQNDIKAESLKRGQGAVIAYIVTGVGLLGGLIVLLNFITTR